MTDYIGRFAPSPTGPLHFGSLIAAVASFLDARAHGGYWLLRIEDLDPPREIAGSAEQIISSLQAHGLLWDGTVWRQSERSAAYRNALAKLQRTGLSYRCDCSRAKLAGNDGIYPGFCRSRDLQVLDNCATRVVVDTDALGFEDVIQGPQSQSLAGEVGDFIVRRRDGLFAYQLAVVVDDAGQGVNHVIRGADLLGSTPRQIYLQHCLGLPTPVYGHIPLATNKLGQKLSKQNLAQGLDNDAALGNLLAAMQFLGQELPVQSFTSPAQLLEWATGRWRRQLIPRQGALSCNQS